MKAQKIKQVVFLFNKRENEVSEVLGVFDKISEAKKEVDKLRKKKLPAFYSSQGYYLELTGQLK